MTYYVYAGLPQSARDVLYRPGHLNQAPGGLLASAEQRFRRTARGRSRSSNGASRPSSSTGTPRGFIPSQDMGYLLVNVQLPDSASLERTQHVLDQINKIAHQIPGVNATVGDQPGSRCS